MRRWAAVLLLVLVSPALAQVPAGTYEVTTVAAPPGLAPEASAVAFGGDGLLYVAFRRGSLFALDTGTQTWRRFATGLHTPLGIVPGAPGELFVAQQPELTRLLDSDGDGRADRFETISDAWGLSGNYHEFVEGLVRDKAGRFVVSLGLASGHALLRLPVRGAPVFPERQAKAERTGTVGRLGHFSPVPYRGCVVSVGADGALSPISCGLRQPNGLVIAPDGAMFATDNQGDWVGTSPLHHVTPGAFHGHPASLRWLPSWKGGDPLTANVDDLARLRKMPAVQFPQNDMAGSLTQPLFLDRRFGPYEGQMIVGEWTYPRLLRAYLEQVDGVYQGAAFILLEGQGLRPSNQRLALTPDGRSLYIAQTSRPWGAVEGLQKVTYAGKVPMDIVRMELTGGGFDLVMTKPVDPATARSPSAWAMTRYRYLYHAQYGSPKADLEPVKVTIATVSADGLRVSLQVSPLSAGRIYELRPAGVRAVGGEPLCTRLAAYTVNRLQKGSPP